MRDDLVQAAQQGVRPRRVDRRGLKDGLKVRAFGHHATRRAGMGMTAETGGGKRNVVTN